MNLKTELEKMNITDLNSVCRKLGLSCNGNKSKIIKKLLKPLKKNYKMELSAQFKDLTLNSNTTKYINKHLNNLKGTPQLTIGLPLKDLPRLFEKKYMLEAVKIGQRTGTKHMFTSLYQNIEQLEKYTIAQHKGTNAYGLIVLINSYINMFMYKHPFDGNTGMKGLPLFMSRNSFSDLYQDIDYNSQLLFEQFVSEAKEKIPKLYLYIYLDAETNCGKQFPLLVTDWLDSIIIPTFEKRNKIIEKFKKYQKKSCRKFFKVNDEFRKKDLMSPPIPYISWIGKYDQRYSMGALDVECHTYEQPIIILECRECIGGAGPTTINTFEKYGKEFITWFTQFAKGNPFDYHLNYYTIGFEYELSRGSRDKHSVMMYTHQWQGTYKDNKGKLHYKKFNLGSSGEMHFDFADKPGMVHEYVSYPFSLEDCKEKFEKFVDDIINYDKHKAIEYFSKKERLENLSRDGLVHICNYKIMETNPKGLTKNKIIKEILGNEWEDLTTEMFREAKQLSKK